MADDDERRRSGRGRKATLTDSERKKDSKWNKCRISIVDQIERWNQIGESFDHKSNVDTARFLIDFYECAKSKHYHTGSKASQVTENVTKTLEQAPNVSSIYTVNVAETPMKIASTPINSLAPLERLGGLSDIQSESELSSQAQEDSDASMMSGVEQIENQQSTSKKGKGILERSSFVDQLQLTIDLSEEQMHSEDNSDDADYEPSVTITLGNLSDSSEEDEDEDSDDCDADLPAQEFGPGLTRITSHTEANRLLENIPFLVYMEQLISLARVTIQKICSVKGCNSEVQMTSNGVGSALYLHWNCSQGHHVYSWCSQPLLNKGRHAGDLMTASVILLSGNNFQKVSLFSKFLNMPLLRSSTYHKIQRTHLVPSIDAYWLNHQQQILAEFQGKDIVILEKNFPNIKHSYDIWHGTKNLTKKIVAAGQDKRNKDLLQWSNEIVNHFWYAAQVTDTYEDFIGVWLGVLHHILDEHEWVLPYCSSGTNRCLHGPLTDDKPRNWLKKGSASHETLRSIVMDKRLLNKIPYFLNFRSTAELENFRV